jgi:hypothetical protein
MGVVSDEHTPWDVARRLAIRRFAEQVRKQGLTVELVREATLEVSVKPGVVKGRQGDFITDGQMVQFVVRALMDNGRAYEKERTIFIAPHDPEKERRRRWMDWGT